MEKELVYGFDIGIASTGSAVSDGKNIIYMGTHVFNEATEAKEPRLNRGARRNLARKKWRKDQLKDAFDDFCILTREEIEQKGYLCFTTNNDSIKKPIDKTIYHLRKRALTEKVSERELFLCLYSMLHARGHFLLETIKFSGTETITFDDFKERFYDAIAEAIELSDSNKEIFEKTILSLIFKEKPVSKEIERLCKESKMVLEENELKLIIAICKYLRNYSVNKKDFGEILEEYKKDKFTVTVIKTSEADETPEILLNLADLHDMINVAQIMKNHDYLCEVAIDKIEEFDREIQKGLDSLEFAEYKKNLKGKGSEKAKHLRSVRNFENNFPNGLYLKEAKAILNNQQKYYPEITNDFIEVCEDIISARIPYYIGPLKNDAKNAWVKKNGKIKYSYKYAQKHNTISPVDEYVTIKAWKDRMRSHCTYLPEEFALPKGSFIAETFSIVNELNILEARDLDENTYYLTFEDKVKIFDNLFLKGGDVKYKDIIDLLGLSYFGPRRASKIEGKMNNKYTLYSSIVRSVPELKVNSIMELFSENKELKDKIDEIEDIILSINLYNEEKTKIDFFVNEKNYSENVAKAFSRLKSNSFFALSKAFIMDKKIGVEGETLLSLLFEDNSFEHPNEQMYHITNAVDENGVALDFSSNKYEEKLKKNGGKLGIDLLMDGTSPVIPVSRTVIRGLNEALKVYDELVKAFGVPKRVVIETARDLKDHTVIKEQSVKHYEDKERFYKSIDEQLKKNKNYKASSGLEKWDQIKPYVTSNKKKIDLYLCQNGIDLLTGEKININHLEDYEIDHILPRGFGDDSMDDKMLISKLANAKKGDRLPLQFIESGEQIGNRIVTSGEFVNRVEMLYDMKLISDNKKKRLLLENTNDLDKFINQNLVDTRYIIKEFASILNAYNKYHDYETHIVSLKAAYTHQYRKSFNFDKDRGFGDQHHAHDAALLIVADKTLSTYYPNYDSRNINNNKKVSSDKYKTYQQLIKDMLSADKKDKGFDEFLRTMFYKAYGISWNNDYSIISQIKKIVPFYSNKVEKNYMGKFFDATILKQKEYDENAVLSILEVNNDKHIFSSINCAAVDFYRYTVEKKGKKEAKHIAIHIPKVIIKTNGEIDKEKYIKLIKEHYKAPELLDENGEIKEGYFRFRAYKNDIIYNTATECPMLFNIGSITTTKLELKAINVFSYNDIYLEGRRIMNDLIDSFNIKTKNNSDGKEFKELKKEELLEYISQKYWNINLTPSQVKILKKMLDEEKTAYNFSNHIAYLNYNIASYGLYSVTEGRHRENADNSKIKTNPDNEYIKLKYNILGLRFIENPFGKFIIESPKQIQGAYSKIRKEKFYWNISKEEL